MLVAIGIALFSLILIYLEFFLPGAVLGILGGIGLFLSILLFIWESAHFWQIISFVFFTCSFLALTIKVALWKLKRKPAFFAQEEQSGYVASEFDCALIGKCGEALTDLKPAGYVQVEGERCQAVSESLYIRKGDLIKIIGGEGARLIVRKK